MMMFSLAAVFVLLFNLTSASPLNNHDILWLADKIDTRTRPNVHGHVESHPLGSLHRLVHAAKRRLIGDTYAQSSTERVPVMLQLTRSLRRDERKQLEQDLDIELVSGRRTRRARRACARRSSDSSVLMGRFCRTTMCP